MEKSTKKLIFIINDCRRSFTYDRVAGFSDAIRKSGEPINLYIFRSAGFAGYEAAHNRGEYNIFRLPDFSDYDGIVLDVNNVTNTSENLYGGRGASYVVRAAAASGKPVISIANRIADFYYVGIDNEVAMTSMIRYLHKDLDLTDFWFIMGPVDNYENKIRTSALMNYCKSNSLPADEMCLFSESFGMETGIRGFERLFSLHRGKLPQAIICANDPIAVGVFQAASSHGIRIPGDVFVTGFDNLNISAYISPSITTIDQFQFNVGSICMNIFKRLWNGEEVEPVTYMDTRVIRRESTGESKPSREDLEKRVAVSLNSEMYTQKVNDQICMMQYKFPDCDTIEDMCKSIELCIPDLKCNGLWIVLDKDLYDYGSQIEIDKTDGNIRTDNSSLMVEGYPDTMEVVFAWNKRNGGSYPHETITGLFPYFDSSRRGRDYMFIPLHFMDATVGFIAISDCLEILHTKNIEPFVNTVTMALRNFFAGKKLEYVNQMLSGISMVDNLTNLYNRLGYHHLAARLFKKTHEEGKRLGVLFIDMDKMKYFNDTFGHACGDDAIRCLSTSIKECISGDAIPVRFGGDEFLVIMPVKGKEEVDELVKVILHTIPVKAKEYNLPDIPGISTGYVITDPASSLTLNDYVEEADKLMYNEKKIKKAGRG